MPDRIDDSPLLAWRKAGQAIDEIRIGGAFCELTTDERDAVLALLRRRQALANQILSTPSLLKLTRQQGLLTALAESLAPAVEILAEIWNSQHAMLCEIEQALEMVPDEEIAGQNSPKEKNDQPLWLLALGALGELIRTPPLNAGQAYLRPQKPLFMGCFLRPTLDPPGQRLRVLIRTVLGICAIVLLGKLLGACAPLEPGGNADPKQSEQAIPTSVWASPSVAPAEGTTPPMVDSAAPQGLISDLKIIDIRVSDPSVEFHIKQEGHEILAEVKPGRINSLIGFVAISEDQRVAALVARQTDQGLCLVSLTDRQARTAPASCDHIISWPAAPANSEATGQNDDTGSSCKDDNLHGRRPVATDRLSGSYRPSGSDRPSNVGASPQ